MRSLPFIPSIAPYAIAAVTLSARS
jgi:hypothetical protein